MSPNAEGPNILFFAFLLVTLSVSLNYMMPSRTKEMLTEWEAKHNLKIIRSIPINRPWSFKWGLFSQAQHFVRVLVEDTETAEKSELILCLGGLLFGLKVKRVRVCDHRSVEREAST